MRHDLSNALLHAAEEVTFCLAFTIVLPPVAATLLLLLLLQLGVGVGGGVALAGVSERRSRCGGMLRFFSGCDAAVMELRIGSFGVDSSTIDSNAAAAVPVAVVCGGVVCLSLAALISY